MMSVKDFFDGLVKDVVNSVTRFIAAFFFTLILFIFSSISIILESEGDILYRIRLMSFFGILFCTFGKLLYERFKDQYLFKYMRTRWSVDVILVLISGLSYFALYNKDNPYVVMGYDGITIALFVGIIYFSITNNISRTFSYIFSKTVFNATVCGVVTLGLFLCIYAFDSLIYHSRSLTQKAYSITALFIWIVLFLNLSLSIISHKDSEQKVPAIFKTIVLYAAFPIYMVLMFILYLYLGKILITLSFPSGEINWLASFASLLFVFFIFSLEQFKEENKLAKLFVKFGGYLIIPIIAVQFMAMYIRLSNYGLTTARFVSLSLSILALVFAVVTLIKNSRYIKYMLPVWAGASLLLTLTPINVLDVPVWNQTSRLMTVLNKNAMLVDGKIVPGKDVPLEDRIKVSNAVDYLIKSDVKKPDIIESVKIDPESFNLKYNNFGDVFGFDPIYDEKQAEKQTLPYKYNSYFHEYNSFDITGYSALYVVSKNNLYCESWCADGEKELVIFIDSDKNHKVKFDIIGTLKALYQQHNDDKNDRNNGDVVMEFSVGGGKLILTEVSYEINRENKIGSIYSIKGFYLKK